MRWGNDHRVLAIDPVSRGLAYLVVEGQDQVVDWGVTGVSAPKGTSMVSRLAALIERFEVDVMVIEDVDALHVRRSKQARELLRGVPALARRSKTSMQQVSWADVWAALGEPGVTNRYGLAGIVAREFPALAPLLPPPKKLWESEKPQMHIFYAGAFFITWRRRVESGATA